MEHKRLNGYHNMWMLVLYDMPVDTKQQRKKVARFRKNLLKSGFTMFQYSVYIRFCGSLESSNAQIKRVESFLEGDGFVNIIMFTDKQYGNMKCYFQGAEGNKVPERFRKQLELF